MAELLLVLAAAVAGALFLRWYVGAVREARVYREIEFQWGRLHAGQAEVVYDELVKRGLRVKLKKIGAPDITRGLPHRLLSVRVHRDDYAEASRIIRALRDGGGG